MEFGPRSLGGRSILGDARNTKMQSVMNLKIKYRESFRPFAPSVLREKVSEYFHMSCNSPYMLLVAPVIEKRRLPFDPKHENLWGIDLLNVPRSDVPAITHIDYSARVQTVHHDTNPRYHKLLSAFEKKTGCAVLVNTSFNVRGEPIVCTPEDAYRCFMRTEMDVLVLENCVLLKQEQKALENDSDWKSEFALD
jgi:carbamoyltransferase